MTGESRKTVPTPATLRGACWIWPENSSWDLYNCYALFRKTFDLAAVPRRAAAFVTADQSYRLYLNGKYVCRGPARGFQSHWPYDEVDIAPLLRVGTNVLAVRAYNPGAGSFQYISQGAAGFLFGARIGSMSLVSDPSWKSRRQGGVQRDTVPSSMQLFPQEVLDARIEPDDWMMPGFDDSAWAAAQLSARLGGMPWPGLEERMIPLLREETVFPAALLGVSEGLCAAGYERTRDVAGLRAEESLEHEPAAEAGAPPGHLEVPQTAAGSYRSYLFDFGRTVVGNLELAVDGATGGEIVDSLHTESIDGAPLKPDIRLPTWCRMAFAYRLICRPGKTRHQFYHPYGFRYLVLTVRDAAVGLRVEVSLNRVGYPLERKGSLQSSDALLTQVWEACAWTQECCSLDAYVDTPWREQAQWWGDARVQGWNTFFLSGDARLTRRGIHCIASQTTPDHLTYGHAPTIAHTCILPDFTLVWILTLWDHYWQTGSLEAFKTHRDVAERALEYFKGQTDARMGLVKYDPRYWLFLDWTGTYDGTSWTGTLFKEGYSAVYNLWLLVTLDRFADMERLAHRTEAAAAAAAWARRLRTALRRLVDPRTGLVLDGYQFDGTVVRTTSVHAQVLAIMAGLSTSTEQEMIDRVLLPSVRGELAAGINPSSFWITYLFSVLSERGFAGDVVSCIKKRWEPMARHGTTFEIFNPVPGDSSMSHAWSAHPLFHLMQIIGGIRQAGPGWSGITFTPEFAGDFGGAVVPTPRGSIRSEWRKHGKEVSAMLALPKGVSALVRLPGLKAEKVTGRRSWKLTQPAEAAPP